MPKLVIYLISLFLFGSYSLAQIQAIPEQETPEEFECEAVISSVDEKITQFEAKVPKHLETYQILWLKVATLAGRGDVLGYDTDKIYDDLDELDALIDKFGQNFDLFITNLTQTKNYACLANQNSFTVAYAKAAKSLSDVKDSANEISTFYTEVLREDILEMERIETNGRE